MRQSSLLFLIFGEPRLSALYQFYMKTHKFQIYRVKTTPCKWFIFGSFKNVCLFSRISINQNKCFTIFFFVYLIKIDTIHSAKILYTQEIRLVVFFIFLPEFRNYTLQGRRCSPYRLLKLPKPSNLCKLLLKKFISYMIIPHCWHFLTHILSLQVINWFKHQMIYTFRACAIKRAVGFFVIVIVIDCTLFAPVISWCDSFDI